MDHLTREELLAQDTDSTIPVFHEGEVKEVRPLVLQAGPNEPEKLICSCGNTIRNGYGVKPGIRVVEDGCWFCQEAKRLREAGNAVAAEPPNVGVGGVEIAAPQVEVDAYMRATVPTVTDSREESTWELHWTKPLVLETSGPELITLILPGSIARRVRIMDFLEALDRLGLINRAEESDNDA